VNAWLRTVGGGEPWDKDFDMTPDGRNDTIGDILSNRDITKQAIVGLDYVQLNVLLNFTVSSLLKSLCLLVDDSVCC